MDTNRESAIKEKDIVKNLDNSTWGKGKVIMFTNSGDKVRVQWPEREGEHGPIEGYIEISKLEKVSAEELLDEIVLMRSHNIKLQKDIELGHSANLYASWEIVELKNQIRFLEERMNERTVGHQEERLLKLARSIISELEPTDPTSIASEN